MKKINLYFLVAILGWSSSQSFANFKNVDLGVKGYFVKPENLVKSYILGPVQSEVQTFVDYINSVSPDVSTSDAVDIAEMTIKAAACFKIDSTVMMALMRLESGYRMGAISPTGAVGLTQFTSIGAREVNDQLGHRGEDYAHPRNTHYLRAAVKTCITPHWKDLWKRGRSWSAQKKHFLRDMELSLTYGAILLKVYLAKSFDEDKKMRDIYFAALRDYNGEPGNRKIWYAKKVLKYASELK